MKKMFGFLRRWWRLSGTRPARTARPRLECLEQRLVPANPGYLQLGALAPAQTVLSGDFTGSGRTDVARLSQSGIWQIGVPQGPAFDMTAWGNWGACSNWRAFVVGDFAGDGRDDIAGLNNAGEWIVGMSQGQRFYTQDWGHFGPPGNWSKILVGDFNGDGMADIAGFTHQGKWVVAVSTGSRFSAQTQALWSSAPHWAWVGVGDFNGDGKSDVVGLTVTGQWEVGLSTGQRLNSQFWGGSGAGNFAADVEVGDFNGDGKADVATLSRAGNWVVGLSDGTQFNSSVWARWGSSGGFDDIEVGDFNGDGSADLIALGQNGTWTIALSQGDDFSTDTWATTGERLPAGLRLQVGYFNGDGNTDAAVFLPTGEWLGAISDGHSQLLLTDMGRWSLGLDQLPYRGDTTPFTATAPWDPSNNRTFLAGEPAGLLQAMFFNTPQSYRTFMDNFYGVVHSWVHEADLDGISNDADLMNFLGRHLDAEFAQTRNLLARLYPGQSAQSYRLLMAMNLAHGFYEYGTPPLDRGLNIERTLHQKIGCCTQLADLELILIRAQGIPARELAQAYNYQTPDGQIAATHVVVYAGGLWLDAEINTAFVVNLNTLGRISPFSRLSNLLAADRVLGFYNWYLQPQVRAEQLARGVDGGIIAFYYDYYFAGYHNGASLVYFERGK
jgi:hypothetical protein